MSAKHTPGPWVADGQNINTVATNRNGPWRVAQAYAAREAWGAEGQDANARLIAAAPDLLAALEAMVTDYRSEGCPDPKCTVCVASRAAEAAAHTAIAKAYGP